MPNKHRYKLLGWNCETTLAEWAKAEAKRRDLKTADILTEALTEYRASRETAETPEDTT